MPENIKAETVFAVVEYGGGLHPPECHLMIIPSGLNSKSGIPVPWFACTLNGVGYFK
jgi:hypothetical protein